MTIKNEADRKSEERRARKRRAVNLHMNGSHGEAPKGALWTSAMMGMTTVERMNLHYELHELWPQDHQHTDLEDWEEMERMNAGSDGPGSVAEPVREVPNRINRGRRRRDS